MSSRLRSSPWPTRASSPRSTRNPPSLAWSLVAGLVHVVVGGVVIAAYPAVHPDVPVRLPAPGLPYRRWGWPDVATFLAGHLVFATLVTVLDRQLV